jgi:hypothetical protein
MKPNKQELELIVGHASNAHPLGVAARLIILSDPILSALPDPQSLTLSYGDGSH